MKRFMLAVGAALLATATSAADGKEQCPEGMLLADTGTCGWKVVLPAPRGNSVTREGIAVLIETILTEDGLEIPVYTVQALN